MNTNIKSLYLSALALLAAALMSGCALTKDYIAVTYVPQANVSKIPGAEAVKLNVQVEDLRTIRDRVSVKKNGYGMEMAEIIATNEVAAVLKSAMETELANRGFDVSGNAITVQAQLSKFYNDFKVGFWSGNAVAEVTMNVQVKQADGSITYSRLVTAEGLNPSLQLASGQNARIALDAALKNAMANLFNDSSFVDSLLKSGKAVSQVGSRN